MSDIAIRAEGLSKEFHIGAEEQTYRTLRESIVSAAQAPLRAFRRWGQNHGAAANDKHRFWALRDLNFEVKRGEVVGVVGRNGAGKSTLLKILSRITEPSEGYAEIHGRVSSLLEVGTGFHAELSGRDNIYLNGAILGMRRREIARKFDEIVEFAEVQKFIDTAVKHYSSGMYLRLAFAVAAHLEPEILIVDEVLAVGDAMFQKKCLGKMQDVAGQGRTVLFVSHNMSAVESFCQTGMLLENGQLTCRDEVTTVLGRYAKKLLDPTGMRYRVDSGNAPFRFESVTILRDRKEIAQVVQTGDAVTLQIQIKTDRPYRGIYVGVSLLDEWGRLVFAFNGKEAGVFIEGEVNGELKVEIDIPHLLLLPGQFGLGLVAVDSRGHVLQEVPTALSFEVTEKDLVGAGYPFNRRHGLMLIPFHMRATHGPQTWEGGVLDQVEAGTRESVTM